MLQFSDIWIKGHSQGQNGLTIRNENVKYESPTFNGAKVMGKF